ncbi:hypothetical protein EG328_003314 [Venturia inaequalis]|uniref:Uncharacterized protein n=1 Tax=Venturia inaequalis TaxID=5025 RepID=A0A8H3VL97_VENIN|nr:hypothetical protein EG328_003314 [Venturia inaequalis]
MSRSYFEPIALARSESSNSPRHSFSSDRTLVETLQPQRPATSHTPNRPSHKRSAATLTTTESSTDTAVSIQGRRKKVKTFLKRMGVGMLESLAYSGGTGNDYGYVSSMDKRSDDEALGDVYGVQLMIW